MVRGRGVPNRGGRNSKDEAESSSSRSQSFQRGGRGRGRNREVICYTCGDIGHMSWNCPRNKSTG